jgi:competence ComEA-like helix-hairpin-helix protein
MERRRYMTGGLSLLALIGSLMSFSSTGCVKLPHSSPASATQLAPVYATGEARVAQTTNINTATAEELEKLPGIGRALAARIISYREQYGSFRRAEHLLIVRGIGDRRFRRLRPLITV